MENNTIEIESRVHHKTLGDGTVTDIYPNADMNGTYFDVHFDKDDNKEYGKYRVSTFKMSQYGEWFD